MRTSEDLNEFLTKLKRKEEEDLAKELANRIGYQYFDLEIHKPEADALKVVPEATAKQLKLIPIGKDGATVLLGVYNPFDTGVKAKVEELKRSGYRVELAVVSLSSLDAGWKLYKFLKQKQVKYTELLEINPQKLKEVIGQLAKLTDLQQLISERVQTNPFEILDYLLAGAITFEASDIHFEPAQTEVSVKFRVDGILYPITTLPAKLYILVKNRIKLASGMVLDILSRAQDGRFTVVVDQNRYEIRTSAIPGIYDETIVMRMLNVRSILIDLTGLGLRPDDLETIQWAIKLPNGLILNTGPTGSGKTTTLYSILNTLKQPEIKIITIEDPVEYHLEGISQTQVDPHRGYTFATGLRSILRQDPDVILIGEIRDNDTAETATHAALTGHLVISTLHTNDSLGAIPRLIDLGVDPGLMAPSLRLIIAQRLVRKICSNCSEEYEPSIEVQRRLRQLLADIKPELKVKLDNIVLRRARGCEQCLQSGYKGRIGIFELLRISATIEKLIYQKPAEDQLLAAAKQEGFVSLQQDALLKALAQITTLEEIERVTGPLA